MAGRLAASDAWGEEDVLAALEDLGREARSSLPPQPTTMHDPSRSVVNAAARLWEWLTHRLSLVGA